MALSGAKTAHARLELLDGVSSRDLSADLVSERLHRYRRAIHRRMRLNQVERALERQELVVCERCPAIDKAELRNALTLARSPRLAPSPRPGATCSTFEVSPQRRAAASKTPVYRARCD
jgi:hypothetical protein